MPKTLRKILIALLAAVFLFCAYQLGTVLLEYRRAEEIYDRQREAVVTTLDAAAGEDAFATMEVDFEALLAEGPDVLGWIWIPDTEISYPVVQSRDNADYLYTTYNGVANRSGSIFADYRCDGLSGQNTILYGHNMKNGTMFSALTQFSDQSFFEAHPVVYLRTPEKCLRYRFFSAYVTEADSEIYTLPVTDPESYAANALAASVVESGVTPEEGKPLLLLSTCTDRLNSERFVLHAVLEEERENS